LAPADAIKLPKSNALAAGGSGVSSSSVADGRVERAKEFDAFPIRWKHFLAQLDEDSANGWNFVPSATGGEKKSTCVRQQKSG
jgi:hypothetical protein